jgi:hypothetical protein
VCPSPQNRGGAHSPASEGLGESQFRRLEKSLALCLLCGLDQSVLTAKGPLAAQKAGLLPGECGLDKSCSESAWRARYAKNIRQSVSTLRLGVGGGGRTVYVGSKNIDFVECLMDCSICRLFYVVFVCVSLYHTIP